MKTENKVLSIFSIIVLALILITMFSYQSINKVNDNMELVNHTREVVVQLKDNLSIMQDVETGQRGFVITGKKKYLEPFNLAIEKIKTNTAQLRNLAKDNPIQQHRIDTLEQLSKLKISLSKEIITSREQNGFEAAMKIINAEKGKNLMDGIRAISLKMQQEEERLLQERTKITDKSSQTTLTLIISGGILSIAIVIFLMLFITQDLKKRTRLEKDLIQAKELSLQR